MNDIQLEKFLIAYGDTEEIRIPALGNIKGYVSDKLNNDILEIIQGNMHSSMIPFYKKLLNERRLIPFVYRSNSVYDLLDDIKSMVFDPIFNRNNLMKKSFYAFYTSEEDRVYLALSNIKNIFQHVDNEWMSLIIEHELMHFTSHRANNTFGAIWKNVFDEFYFHLFNYYNTENDSVLEKFVKGYSQNLYKILLSYEKGDMNKILKNIIQLYTVKSKKILNTNMSKIKRYNFNVYFDNATDLIGKFLTLIFTGRTDNAIRLLAQYDYLIFYNLIDAYTKMDKNNPVYNRTLFYQEYFAPSEVAAILSMGRKYKKETQESIKALVKTF